jgi:hypothetical protein
MTRLGSLVVLGLALLAGCAHRPDQGFGDDRAVTPTPTATEADLQRLERELGGLMAAPEAVDCARAFLLRDNICGLADRICKLVEGRSPDAPAPARCEDARARCRSARVRVAGPCPEATKPGF